MLRTDYIRLAKEIQSFTDEDWWLGNVPDGTPDTYQLTLDFIESGGSAWGFPVFEKEAFNILHSWASEGKLIRVQMFAASWLGSATDAYTHDLLTQWATGEYFHLLNSNACKFPGSPDRYLYPLNMPMLELATQTWDDFKSDLRAEARTKAIVKRL